jgi:hypothetical protein
MKITDDMVEQACLTYGRIMLASGKMWNLSEAGQDAMHAALEAVINPSPGSLLRVDRGLRSRGHAPKCRPQPSTPPPD